MAFFSWSKTAATNATADTSINWAEGQAPSSVNDSARAMMARTAEYRDDTSGALVATGTASAFAVTTNQVFTSTTNMRFNEITFIAPVTNAAGVTLNVDGLGAGAINSATGVAIPAGALIAGSVYTVTYYLTANEFILRNFYGNPYQIPVGGIVPYAGSSAPNSNFAIPLGQAVSRTTYATLFTLIGTTYGVGDGSTTFNLPDLGGRTIAYKEATATRLTTAGGGVDGGTLGAVGGTQTHTLTTAQIPAHTHVNTLTDPGHVHGYGLGGDASGGSAIPSARNGTAVNTQAAFTGITITNASAGGGGAHPIVQPTIVMNSIMRVL